MDFKSRQNLKKHQMSSNQKAASGAIKFMSAVIIVAVVFYAEVMYLGIISTAFPDGVFRALASMGAVASGLSVLALVLGKMYWFPPGGQTIWAWCFTALETLILVLNLLLSFEIHWNNVDSYMATWRDFSPASPIFALVGWIIIWQLDSSTRARHAMFEQENIELESELDYRGQVHVAIMDLKHNYLSQTVENLKYEFSSPEVQGQLRQGARDLAAGVLSEFTNIPVAPRPPARVGLPAAGERVVAADPGSGSGESMVPPRQYEARSNAQVSDGPGFFGGLVDKAKGLFSGGEGGQDGDDSGPSDAALRAQGLDPKLYRDARAGAAEVADREASVARPEARVIRPEPSVVADRRRARYRHYHGAPGARVQQPETLPETPAPPLTVTPLPEATVPASELGGEVIAKRTKKKTRV